MTTTTERKRINMSVSEVQLSRWRKAAELRGIGLQDYIRRVVDHDSERPMDIEVDEDGRLIGYPAGYGAL